MEYVAFLFLLASAIVAMSKKDPAIFFFFTFLFSFFLFWGGRFHYNC